MGNLDTASPGPVLPIKPTVLIIEDNPVQQLTYRGIFRSRTKLQGLEPIMVRTVGETLAWLNAITTVPRKPVLILLDWILPDTTGLELLKRFKADKRWAGIPVILISGHADRDSLRKAKGEGAMDFMTKPVRADVLVEKIERYLSLPGTTA